MKVASPSALSGIRATVTLVALCFVSVLGISLAGYIAVCSRTMQLGNRTFQTGLSQQLAEQGLEEGLRAFNKNDWSGWSSSGTSVVWDTTTYAADKRAVATISFPPTKFGQGVTGSVKIRVDNYDANQLGSTWTNGTSYRTSDTVNYNGTWYRCVRATSSQTPNGFSNMFYWVPVPVASFWDATITYKDQDVVFYTANNTWYRCILAPTANQVPTNATYWTSIPRITQDSGYTNTNIELVMYFGTWYYWNNAWYSMPANTPIASWVWRSGYNYSFNDLVYYGGTPAWYRCINPHTSSGSILPTNPSYWENALTGSWAWNSGYTYNLNDVVYRSGSFYRCILAHSNQGPPNTTYWSNAPLYSTAWDSGRQYRQNDTVRYNGVWYRYIYATPTNGYVPTNTTYWIGANTGTASYQWNPATAYAPGDYKSYGGVWYKCISATTANAGHSPNNTTYWTATWANSWGITTGAPVVYAEGTVNLAGSPSIKTQLRATIAPAPLFPNAVGATTTLTISSGTGTVDSYDSTLVPYNAGSAGSSAVLAAGSTLAINGTTAIKGYLAWPSPPAGISTGTTINGLTLSVDKSRVSRSPFIPQFNIKTVAGGTLLALAATTTIGTPGATTPSVYYYPGDLNLDGKTLNINGPVILDVQGELRVHNSGMIVIASTGAAEIHFSGRLRIQSSGSGIDNRTLDPKKLILIGTATGGTGHNFSSPTPFYGAIYMPNSTTALTIDNGVTIYGALSAKNITFSSEATVHYDTSLRYATFGGVDQPCAITEWRELTDPAERATLP